MVTVRVSEAQPFGNTSTAALAHVLAQNATFDGESMKPDPRPRPRLMYVTVFARFATWSAVSTLAKVIRTGCRLRAAIANACCTSFCTTEMAADTLRSVMYWE